VLRTPVHPVLSGRLLVLTYRGHRSGATFTIPLRYAETADGHFVAAAVDREQKRWWQSFTKPRAATLLVRGTGFPVVGVVAEGARHDVAREAYIGRYPRSGRLLGDAALVVFERTG
jgi:hypothetical protein